MLVLLAAFRFGTRTPAPSPYLAVLICSRRSHRAAGHFAIVCTIDVSVFSKERGRPSSRNWCNLGRKRQFKDAPSTEVSLSTKARVLSQSSSMHSTWKNRNVGSRFRSGLYFSRDGLVVSTLPNLSSRRNRRCCSHCNRGSSSVRKSQSDRYGHCFSTASMDSSDMRNQRFSDACNSANPCACSFLGDVVLGDVCIAVSDVCVCVVGVGRWSNQRCRLSILTCDFSAFNLERLRMDMLACRRDRRCCDCCCCSPSSSSCCWCLAASAFSCCCCRCDWSNDAGDAGIGIVIHRSSPAGSSPS
mmetsp:Transcript_2854/g.7997  ORF Transcript_2854/g.7997 Transcript_2854/m.7997 type:complete len:301 (+) Transcript_2854:437-1339(+)